MPAQLGPMERATFEHWSDGLFWDSRQWKESGNSTVLIAIYRRQKPLCLV
jgi:hypothetical protein